MKKKGASGPVGARTPQRGGNYSVSGLMLSREQPCRRWHRKWAAKASPERDDGRACNWLASSEVVMGYRLSRPITHNAWQFTTARLRLCRDECSGTNGTASRATVNPGRNRRGDTGFPERQGSCRSGKPVGQPEVGGKPPHEARATGHSPGIGRRATNVPVGMTAERRITVAARCGAVSY